MFHAVILDLVLLKGTLPSLGPLNYLLDPFHLSGWHGQRQIVRIIGDISGAKT